MTPEDRQACELYLAARILQLYGALVTPNPSPGFHFEWTSRHGSAHAAPHVWWTVLVFHELRDRVWMTSGADFEDGIEDGSFLERLRQGRIILSMLLDLHRHEVQALARGLVATGKLSALEALGLLPAGPEQPPGGILGPVL